MTLIKLLDNAIEKVEDEADKLHDACDDTRKESQRKVEKVKHKVKKNIKLKCITMDLHSGLPYWIIKNPLFDYYNPLKENLDTDIIIIGSGITGAPRST